MIEHITLSFDIHKLHLKLLHNAVVDVIKLILLIYNNFSIVKITVNKNRKSKVTQSRLPTNTELIFNKLVVIKTIQNG